MKNNASHLPYPPSSLIKRVIFNSPIVLDKGNGDQWSTTWADDDNLYTAWGDGTGFGCVGKRTLDDRVFLGLARLSGYPPDYQAANIWGGYKPESSAPALYVSQEPKPENLKPGQGLVFANGKMYLLALVHGSDNRRNRLLSSTDYGKTWQDHGFLFDHEPYYRFAESYVIQFGKNYSGVPDHLAGYVYLYSMSKSDWVYYKESGRPQSKSTRWDDPTVTNQDLVLARVPLEKIEQRSAYEFYCGGGGGGSGDGGEAPAWSKDINDATSVFHDPNGANWHPYCVYNPWLKRFILVVKNTYNPYPLERRYYNCDSAGLGMYEAENPWGPWHTFHYTWQVGRFIPGLDLGISFTIPQKWMENDGRTMWMIFAGRGTYEGNSMYGFNLVKLELDLNL